MNTSTHPKFAAIAIAIFLMTGPFHPTQAAEMLPQDHSYQVVLRDHLAQLQEADFEIPLDKITFDPTWVSGNNDLHRLWLLFGIPEYNRFDKSFTSLPSMRGITIAADNFLLANIESDEGIVMDVGWDRQPGAFPADNAWWSNWDYPGNPFYQSKALRNRAFTAVAVDMIMLDHLHESGTDWVANGRRSDFLGGNMIWLAYVYHIVRKDLPKPVQEAFETGLAKFVDRLTEWGPTAVNDNMDMKACAALVYLVKAVDDGPIVDKARAYVRRNLDRIVHPAGIIRDAGGIEASYSGIALQYLVMATAASRWPELSEALGRMSDLKAHMTLPEPDGENVYGPSNFSLRTSPGYPNDQHSYVQRDIAAAMIRDEALYLMFGGRRGRQGPWASPSPDAMLTAVQQGIDQMNALLTPSDRRLTPWVRRHWGSTMANWAHDYYTPGFYDRLVHLHQTNDPLTLPPVARPDARYMRIFPDPARTDLAESDRNTFLIVRFQNYGATFDAAPLTWYKPQRLTGFSGGTLSSFWTPEGGSMILGRSGGRADTDNRWEDWRIWPVHALSGVTPTGGAFSSARLSRNVAEVDITRGDGWARAEIRGPIGARYDSSRAAHNNSIEGLVEFRRRLLFEERGILIESSLIADGADQVAELYEVIPLFLGEVQNLDDIPHRIQLRSGDNWLDATADFQDDVTAVRVERFNGALSITFQQPQRVRLADRPFETTYMSHASTRNLLVDLLPGNRRPAPLPSVTIRYRISPEPLDAGQAALPWPDWTSAPIADDQTAPRTPARQRAEIIQAIPTGAAAIPLLRQALAGDDPSVRQTAVQALGRIGQTAAPVLLEALDTLDPESRGIALAALHTMDALPRQRLLQALADDDPTVRQTIVDALDVLQSWNFLPDLPPADYTPRLQLQGNTIVVPDETTGNYLETTLGEGAHGAVIASHPNLSPKGPFSIEMRFNLKSDFIGRGGYLLDKMAVAAAQPDGMRDYRIMLSPAGDGLHRLEVTLGFGQEEGISRYTTSPLRLEPDTWQHLLFTYDGKGGGAIHLNGQLQAEALHPNRGPILPGDYRLAIAERATSNFAPFIGRIADLRLHHRLITP